MDFPKKQQQCLIPRYLLQYLQDLQISHNDPTAPWGGGGGGGSYTAGTGIDITDENVISIDNTVALKTDIPSLTGYATETWVTTELLDYVELDDLATVATTGNYNDLTNKPTIPTDTSDLTNGAGYITSSALNGYATESWVTSQGYQDATAVYIRVYNMLQPYATEAWVTNQGYSTFSGSYNDLTDKPTIPTVPTNISAFTNDSGYITLTKLNEYLSTYATEAWVTNQGYITSASLSNYVTTNTAQNITGVKTFIGDKKLGFKQLSVNDVIGFTAYNNSGAEVGNLQVANRTVGGTSYKYVTLGNYSTLSDKSKLGFRVQPNSSTNSYNFVMPYGTNANFTANTYSTSADTTIPCAFTDGNTIVKADATGLVDISSITGGGSSGPTITRYDTSSYIYATNWTTSNKICSIWNGSANSGRFRIDETNPGDILIFDITLLYYSNGYPINKRYSIQLIVPAQSTNTSYSSSHELIAQAYEIYKTGATSFSDNMMTLNIEKLNTTSAVIIGELTVPGYFTTNNSNRITVNAITHIAF